jgi:hypothetical protein
VRGMGAHRLGGHLGSDVAGARPAPAGKQVVVRLGPSFEDVALKVFPQRRIGERELADLLALGEDRQPATLVVKVLELDLEQRALADPVVEQKPQGDPVPQRFLLGDDRAPLLVENVVR